MVGPAMADAVISNDIRMFFIISANDQVLALLGRG
jgi:hypothetical protein